MIRRPPRSTRTDTLFPYTTLFRSHVDTWCGGANIEQTRLRWVMGCGCHPRRVCLVLAPSDWFHNLRVWQGGTLKERRVETMMPVRHMWWRSAYRTKKHKTVNG